MPDRDFFDWDDNQLKRVVGLLCGALSLVVLAALALLIFSTTHYFSGKVQECNQNILYLHELAEREVE